MMQSYPVAAKAAGIQRPPVPASVRYAARVMYAGAVVAVINAVVFVMTASATKGAIEAKHPHLSASSVSTLTHIAVIFVAVVALIGAVLFVWIARSCVAGKNWTRITAMALLVLAALGTAYNLGPGVETTVNVIFTFLLDLIGLAAVVLLWRRSSSAYFTFFKRPQF